MFWKNIFGLKIFFWTQNDFLLVLCFEIFFKNNLLPNIFYSFFVVIAGNAGQIIHCTQSSCVSIQQLMKLFHLNLMKSAVGEWITELLFLR